MDKLIISAISIMFGFILGGTMVECDDTKHQRGEIEHLKAKNQFLIHITREREKQCLRAVANQ